MNSFKYYSVSRHRLTTDGEGVTSLVALKGCPLKCKYCINSDILNSSRIITKSCAELEEEIRIDYCYFAATNGGITFGGGEPLLQAKAILEFENLVPDYVSVNIETSLNVDVEQDLFEKLLLKTTSLIIDIKALDELVYNEYTGLQQTFLTKNLDTICALGYQNKCKIKIPVIPGFKSKESAIIEEKYFQNKGFSNTLVFDYVIRDYMNK